MGANLEESSTNEIEITPEMIEAGKEVYYQHVRALENWVEGEVDEFVKHLYREMRLRSERLLATY